MLKKCSLCNQNFNHKALVGVGSNPRRDRYCSQCVSEADFLDQLGSELRACDPHGGSHLKPRVAYAAVLDHIINDVANPCDSIQGLLFALKTRRGRL